MELGRLLNAAHGARRCYQTGCRCVPCNAANTAYSAQYRQAIRAGHPPLGAHVVGAEVDRALAALAELIEEGYPRRAIATALGHRAAKLQYGHGMTLRSVRRILRVHADWIA